MIVFGFPVGPLQANCYVVGDKDTKEAAVIDPGGDYERILAACGDKQIVVKKILLTHGHADHAGVAARLKAFTGAELCCHRAELPLLEALPVAAPRLGMPAADAPVVDRFLDDGDTVQIGEVSIQVLHTPGHSPGGLCYFAPPCVFTGDTLFHRSVGRTDLPGGDGQALLRSIHDKLLPLGDEVVVLPGHMDKSDIGAERRTNPFLQ